MHIHRVLRRNCVALSTLMMGSIVNWSSSVHADTLYKTNSGANTVLNTATHVPAAPGAIIQTYAEGTAFTAADVIAFNNLITAATTFRISSTTGTNLQVGGITVLNPSGAITIQNGAGASGSPVANTLTIGSGGIDLSNATNNLTLSQDTANGSSLLVTTSADQTWTVRNQRTLTISAPLNLAHNVTIGFTGGTQGGTPGIVSLGSSTTGITGAGNLNIAGMVGGAAGMGGSGGQVTLLGNNSTWTGAVTVGGGARLNLDQSAAGQNKLADAQTLTINRGQVNLQGTGGGTEVVAGVALGQGLNQITRSAGTGILQANTISRSLGAAVNFGNIATSGASHVTMDNLNTAAGQIGAWAVGINGTTDANWIKTAAAGSDNTALALSGADYTTDNNLNNWLANQNIIVTGATTASAASRTIGSLKMTTAAVASLDIGAGNILTIDDGANGGGIIGVGNFARTIGAGTVGQGTLTAGLGDDSVNDTLFIYNLQNTITINMVIANNNTGIGTDTLHLFSGGAGTVTVAANNTFTGGTTIAAGTLAIGNNTSTANDAGLGTGDIVNHGTLVLSKTTGATVAQMTLANNMSGTGAFTLNRGTATLTGNNTYQGDTTLGNAAGATTIKAGSATAFSGDSRIVITQTGGAGIDLNGFDSSVAALRATVNDAVVALGANTLTLTGSNKARPGANDLVFDLSTQAYQGTITGTGNLIKDGLYTQSLTGTGAVSYTGTTTVNAGIFQTDKAMSTSGVTVNTTSGNAGTFLSNVASSLGTTATMNLAGTRATWQVNNGFNQSIGAITGVANSRLAIARGAATTNVTATDNGGAASTFAGVIQEIGAGVNGGSFTKDGTNTLILTGGNNYSGATTINGGILQIGVANLVQVIPDRSAVVLGDVVGATLDLNGNNETIGSLAGGGTTGGTVSLGAGTLTLGLDNTSANYGGAITGTGGLSKMGTGTQTLSGANTFTGNVSIGNVGGQSGGGLALSGGNALADTAEVRNSGWNTTLAVDSSETMGPITSTRSSVLALGSGATATSNYTNGTPTALAATADSASANGRVIRNIDTSGLKAGDLISGTGVSAPGYIVQILSADAVLVNRTPPTGPTNDFAPTVTSVSVLGSAMTGSGGFTKDGTGLLILTGDSTHSGATTINNGTVQVGGIWTGQKFSRHDTLSNNSQIVFSDTNATTLQFADSTNNLLPLERVGSIAGGAGATTLIRLEAGATAAVLAIGGDNSTSTFTGSFMGPGGGSTMVIKEGTGNFTWSNPTSNVFDGPVYVENGAFTIAGAQGFDGSNEVYMSNQGATLNITTTGGDTIPFLHGGAGATRTIVLGGIFGGTQSNYLTSGTTVLNLTTNLTVSENTTANIYTFNGDIQGAANLTKSGNHQFNLTGVSSNAHTGQTVVTAGTLRMAPLSAAAGVGAPTAGQNGTLSTSTRLRLTGGVLDINSTAQTVSRIDASSTGGTIALGNGSLTLSDQNTQSTATVITGNANSVLNLNASAASTLTLTGNSTGFGGTINVGTNAALTLNRSGGALNSSGIPAARINLNGAGTQLTVTLADTIGSLAGIGNAVLTQALTLREAASGTVSSTGYSGATSGAGALILSNFGGLTLSGNNAHSGGTTLSNGSALHLNYGSGNNILPGTGALTLAGASLRIFSDTTSAAILESVASTSLNAGAAFIESWRVYNAESATNQGNGLGGIGLGAITRAAGGMIHFEPFSASTSTANLASGILGGYATFNERTWAVGDGAGLVAVTGLGGGSYTADLWAPGNHTDVTISSTPAGTTTETLRFNTAAANTVTIGANSLINTGGILVTTLVGANNSTITDGGLGFTLGAADDELKIHQFNRLGDLVISAVLDNNGSNTIVSTSGPGRIILTENTVGTGGTNIGYGYLQFGNGGNNGGTGSGAILNQGTLGVNLLLNKTFNQVISGTGNFEQLGANTTTLGGANTFSGRVTVKAGTLEVTNNSGLGLGATSPTDRWANLTSVDSGATLLINVAAGGTITEVLHLDGGTLDLRSTVATSLAAPIILSSDSTFHVSNPGAAVSHTISGEIFAFPGSDLTVTNVGGATPSTLILAPTATTGARWENTTVGANATLQIGNNSRGWVGTGNIVNDGTVITNTNNGHLALGNQISGSGSFVQGRNTVYLTADNTYTGATTVGLQSINAGASLRIGNDTYTGMHGTGDITIQAVTGGNADFRYHLIEDNTISNNITINANTDGTTARNATLLRQGIGNITLTGNLTIGATNAAPGTERAILQTESGGKLTFAGTLVGAGPNNLLNIVNNGIFVFGGSASNTYNGVLSGNSVWVYQNTGTTTLAGANTVNSGHNYLQKGTVVLTGGAASHDDNDWHVHNGATLSIAQTETIGLLYMQRGATTSIAAGQTLTVDDNAAQLIAGSITGSGNLTLGGGNYMAMYGVNTASGIFNINNGTLQLKNTNDAIGSFSTVNLGSGTTAGNLEYVGSGETYSGNFNLAGTTGGARITANGNGAWILSGNITNTGAGNKTLTLSGQTGGYFNSVKNQITGAITEGANTLSLAMPATGDDDRFGLTGRWALTNASNDFSGGITVNTGMLEFGGDLGTGGAVATSQLGDLTVARTITLGTNNYSGRRYDMFGSGDQIGAAGSNQGTNTLAPNSGSTGTIIFNSTNAATFTLPSNITLTQAFSSTTNPGSGQIINDGAGAVVIQGNLTAGASGNRTWFLDGTNTGTNTISGIISDTSTTGSNTVGVVKEGAGTWRLSGANTYEGVTAINNGILELSGGAAIRDANTVAINGDGGDGLFSGTAKLRVVTSETIGLLTGDVLTEAEILAGQTLTIGATGTNTMNGLITGDGNLTRTNAGTATALMNASAKNTYGGVTTIQATGTASANAQITVWHLADGGVASGIGQSSNAAANLVFGTDTAGDNGGILQWQGLTNQSTDRLFTMGLGTAGARINASGTLLGTTAPTLTFSNTGAIAFTGAGARTLTLGGTTISDNTFRPQITDGGGVTSLTKADGGLWVINPDVAGNTYTGTTTISGGTLAIMAGNALGSGLINITGGGGSTGLEVRSGITLANNITSAVDDASVRFTTGTSVLTGTLTLTGQLRFNVESGASAELNNAVAALAGADVLIKLGGGNLILSGVHTATGATSVRGGTLTLEYGTNNTSKLADAATLTLGGAGALTTLGSDANVNGQTNIVGTTGGTIVLSGGTHVEQVSATTLAQGANAVMRTSGTAVINLENITRAVGSGATIDFGAASIATSNNLNGTGGILNTTGGGAGTATGAFATVAKTDWAVTAGTGTDVAITALAAYSADAYAAGNNTDVVAFTPTGGAVTTNTLRFNQAAGGTLTLGGNLSLQSAGLLMTPASGNVIITGGAIQNAATTANLDAVMIHQHSTLGALQIDSIIQNNSGAGQLTKSGAGTVYLNALNTQTGALNLNEGILQVGGTIAAPTIATAARLGGTNVAINMSEGATLLFLSSDTNVQDLSTIQGGGTIVLAAGNVMPVRMDTDNGNFYGDIEVRGGTLEIQGNNNALGSNRGITTIFGGGVLQFNDSRSTGEFITYEEGAVVTKLAPASGTLSGKQTFNNTTTAGLTFDIPAHTTVTSVGLNISGIVYGNNGFTKTGDGILQISANNFSDVYDGYTGINKTPTLLGQIQVNAGILYVGGTRALGAFGAGNETIVASGATVDLRDQDLNLGDDSDANREIFKIQGTGFNSTGALRNSAGTAQLSFLTLDGDATINSGGTGNASALILGTFDTNLSNANGLTGAVTRNRPVIEGNNNDLTVIGGRNATDNMIFAEPTFASALNSLNIAGSSVRFRHEVSAALAAVPVTSADITNGITVGYAGESLGDVTNSALGLGANTGARLLFENYRDIHHTVDITLDGALAATNNGANYLEVDFFTIPDGTTYLDGDLNLTGAASRNVLVSNSLPNFSVAEQGNTTVAPVTKMVIGGVVQGTGGFTKVGFSETRLTNTNTFSGDVNVLRFGTSAAPWSTHTFRINGVDYTTQGLSEGWAEWGLTLNGPNGSMTDVGTITLQRRGMITLDNTNRLDATSGVVGANNNNRIADDSIMNMSNGWLRINGGTVNNTEALGTVNVQVGTNILDLYPTDGAGTNMTLTIDTLNRSTAGGVLRVQNLDATSTFSTAAVGESVRMAVTTLGATQIGGGGAANSTTQSIVQGVFGGTIPLGLDTDFRLLGFNNGNVTDLWNQQRNLQFLAGSHFMVYDGGFLRPLDDDEYFTPADGILSTAIGANQNVNLNDVFTVVKEDTTINALRFGPLFDNDGTGGSIYSNTTLTSLTDHHSIQLMVDGTLKISSGMISSAYFSIGNTSSLSTIIMGGTLDFDGKEAIINNQNGNYYTTSGVIGTGNLEIRSIITNANGLTKTGLAQVLLDGANTYTGITYINDGTLFIRNGRSALGAGGAGNGVVITGNGSLNSGNGIVVGTPTAREDIYIGVLQGDQQIMRNDNDVTVWNSNLTIDNVDIAGQTIFTPRIRTDNSATSIINGNIGGGSTAIINDITQIDSRIVQFDTSGNNVFIIRGQIGDKLDGSGNAVPIPDPISTLPTLAGTRTNENEVLRVTLAGGTDESNFILDRQYNAAGRITLSRGTTIINYDPTAPGNDGGGFWTDTAISRIPNADSATTTFAINGGTSHQGIVMGTTSNLYNALFLARAGQTFNMATWTMVGTGVKVIGGLNETGTVTYGNGTGSLIFAGATANLYAADGGTVVFNQRMAGNVGTAPSSFGFLKQGRGTVELQNTGLATAADANFILAGGTLVLNHDGQNVARVGNQNARFEGGTLVAVASTTADSTANIATDNAANRVLNFSIGGTEIVARSVNAGSAGDMTVNLGNANANNTSSNLVRSQSATVNFVEDNSAGGTAQITLNFNATTTAAVKNQVIPWATYGTLSRTAVDFAMADVGAANDVRAFGRALDEYQNDVSAWQAGWDVSENGGAGFSGTLAGALSVSTIRFDSNADSTVDLGTNTLTVAGNGLASSGGAILVSSNVGSANKTITGGAGAVLTTTGGTTELIIHHYGSGNLNINVPINGANDLTIAGPSTTNAATIGTTGAVVLGAANTFTGKLYLNGAILSFSNTGQLGPVPGAATADQITFNGGTLRFTGSGLVDLGVNRGLLFNGNGGTIDVADSGGELLVSGDISSNSLYRGDLIKVGAGTLTLQGGIDNANGSFQGLIDVRQGGIRLNGDNQSTTSTTAITSTALGTSNSYADGTIFRTGTSLAVQMGNRNDSSEWNIDEWMTFEGNNYVSIGTINTQTANVSASGFPNPNNERPINFGGVITLNGATTFDVVPSQTFRIGYNGTGAGYLTGNGDLIKDGIGTMELRTNNPDYTGNIIILQGRLYAMGQADPLGTGYLTGKTITLGSTERQGIAELSPNSESSVHGWTIEVNHDVNVVYNPAQTKRILFESFGNGSRIDFNGDITLNDNLQFYINDGAEVGGSQNYVNLNGQLKDGATTSGNLLLTGDDAGGANDNTSGRPYNYLVLKNDNSLWTGDVRINTNTSYDQDQTAILRLEHNNALTAANDVDMGFNSMLQVGGGTRTIGSLSTNGGVGPFIGGAAGGTMGASTNGSTEIIENAASTAGSLTITQTTPVSIEVQWDAHFRDGTLNSEFFAPGANTFEPSASLSIVKAGGGWATLTLDNDYTGTTTVTGGVLQVGRGGVGDTGAVGAAGLISSAGTTVAGTGIIQGNSTINGLLRPGDEAGGSMGTLMVNGNLTLGSTSVTTFQVQRSTYTAMNVLGYDDAAYGASIAGVPTDAIYSHLLSDPVLLSQHDQLLITGGLTVTNGATKVVLANNGYNPTAGDIFNLIDWVGAISGSFNVGGTSFNGGLLRTGAETGTDLDLFELGGGYRWDVSLFNTHGILVVVVPEPGRAVLLLGALLAIFWCRRRTGAGV